MKIAGSLITGIVFFWVCGITFADDSLPLHLLKVPPGFSVSIFAKNIPDARSLALGDKGTVFVGTRTEDKVYAVIKDPQHPNQNKVITIASGLTMPNGVAFRHGSLYVAERSRILRFDNIEAQLEHPPKPVIINDTLPDKSHHGWRYIKFGADDKLYVGIGGPCDSCISEDLRFGTIMRMDADGKNFEIFARGVRNTLGFDWDPVTKQLWFTENSRDWMGDELPPEELNLANKSGMHFGFPYCYGKSVPDPEYGKDFPCSAFVPPRLELPAHVAPLGMTFYTGKQFPAEYHHHIFLAEHGSWNRSKKIGYQVMDVTINGDKVTDARPFISGWMQGQSVWGRPVDVLVMPDGALLVSDDHAGVIYKIVYKK